MTLLCYMPWRLWPNFLARSAWTIRSPAAAYAPNQIFVSGQASRLWPLQGRTSTRRVFNICPSFSLNGRLDVGPRESRELFSLRYGCYRWVFMCAPPCLLHLSWSIESRCCTLLHFIGKSKHAKAAYSHSSPLFTIIFIISSVNNKERSHCEGARWIKIIVLVQ